MLPFIRWDTLTHPPSRPTPDFPAPTALLREHGRLPEERLPSLPPLIRPNAAAVLRDGAVQRTHTGTQARRPGQCGGGGPR